MGAINFDLPSRGDVSSNIPSLTIVNKNSTGEAVHAEAHSNTVAAIAAYNQQGNAIYGKSTGGAGSGVMGQAVGTGPGVWAEGLGNNYGLLARSATGEAVHAEAHSNTVAAISGLNQQGTAVYGESTDGTGIIGISRGSKAAIIGDGSLAGQFKGDVEVTGDIRLLAGHDCAEVFDISSANIVEPGTVMVMNSEGNLQESYQKYDKSVAGIVAGAGNYKPGIILGKSDLTRMSVSISLVGRTYCKVDADYSSIEIGDLLTTSDTKGYAMRADDPSKAFGTVIGKALKPLQEGKGIIPVLVALQ